MVINFSEEKRLRKIKGLQQLGQYIVILGLFLISATIFAHAEDEDIHDSPSSFLWQIEYAGKEVGALLGTVHIGTQRLYRIIESHKRLRGGNALVRLYYNAP